MKRLTRTAAAILCLFSAVLLFGACAKKESGFQALKKTGQMELLYAEQFSVDYLEGGYSLITIEDSGRFLVVPEGSVVPEGLDEDIVPLRQPVDCIYLAASSAMDIFRKLDALDIIKMTGTKASDWSIPEIAEKVEKGEILYGGKYSAPDYEMLLANSCELAIESTMIYHTPKVKEQLEGLGIPVMTERSSYEAHPLGRVEWIRLYALLAGKEEQADAFMKECSQRLDEVLAVTQGTSKKTTAFFYIASNGAVNVRKPGDYISKMIEMAGGEYIFSDLISEDESALSTVNMQMEAFYEKAVDSDIIIYNSTVQTELDSIDELLEKSPLLADFKAVKNGDVYCTEKNMYQETCAAIDILEDFYKVINEGQDASLKYLHILR